MPGTKEIRAAVQEALRTMIDTANLAGGFDNITAVLVTVAPA